MLDLQKLDLRLRGHYNHLYKCLCTWVWVHLCTPECRFNAALSQLYKDGSHVQQLNMILFVAVWIMLFFTFQVNLTTSFHKTLRPSLFLLLLCFCFFCCSSDNEYCTCILLFSYMQVSRKYLHVYLHWKYTHP